MKYPPISIAYALAWKCYCNCPICLSGVQGKEYMITDINKWKKNIAPVIAYNGSVRLSLTGGEPMLFWDKTDELLEFIKYLHKNEIHVCLNTTGANMTAEKLKTLDKYLDTILLSVRGFSVENVSDEFGIDEKYAEELRNTQLMILHEIHKTNIKLEIATVVTKKNSTEIDDIGAELCKINKNVIWRIEEYYRNGKQVNQTNEKFDLEAIKYKDLVKNLTEKYSNDIFIRESSKENRLNAPDPFLFPDGDLHSTSDNAYRLLGHIEQYDFTTIKTRRNWDSYQKSMRNWGWERDNY